MTEQAECQGLTGELGRKQSLDWDGETEAGPDPASYDCLEEV